MLVFGHAGITLGTAALIVGWLRNSHLPKTERNILQESSENKLPEIENTNRSWFSLLGRYVDIRILFIGSLLPDIIDKPIGQIFFKEIFSNGRIFGHTLLFLLIITLAALYLYRYHNKTWLLALSFGTFLHLVCDQMWLSPKTLLWPVYGFTFERVDLTRWISDVLAGLLRDPAVYIPELVGLAILLWFTVELVRKRNLFNFVKYGQIS